MFFFLGIKIIFDSLGFVFLCRSLLFESVQVFLYVQLISNFILEVKFIFFIIILIIDNVLYEIELKIFLYICNKIIIYVYNCDFKKSYDFEVLFKGRIYYV